MPNWSCSLIHLIDETEKKMDKWELVCLVLRIENVSSEDKEQYPQHEQEISLFLLNGVQLPECY